MGDAPRVSVLMTVFNAAPWLREAVDSVVHQTHTDWELVAIENGCTDDSPSILTSYADPRLRVISVRENMGRTPALRHAFGLARGEYIAVLDADDVADPARFAKQVTFLDANPAVTVVGSWTTRIDGLGQEFGLFTPPTDSAVLLDHLGYENPIVHSSAMYRAAVARAVGGYPAEHPYAQDCGLWLRLAERGPIAMIAECLASHRSLPGSMTRSKESQVMVALDNLALLEYACVHLPLSRVAQRRNREERTIAACRLGVALLRTGQHGDGLAYLLSALRSDPAGVLWNRVTRGLLGT